MVSNAIVRLTDIQVLLSPYAFSTLNEKALQDGIEQVLRESGIEFIREARVTKQDRPDFMIDDVAVEAKIKDTISEVTRQLHRYAQLDSVQAILLVTSRHTHRGVMSDSKRLHILFTN